MELDPLQRLFEPLLPRQPHLLFLILGYLPRLKKQLRVIQRPQLFDPILDVFAFRVVIMCLFDRENIISIAQVKQQSEAIQEKKKQGKRFGCVKIYLKRRKRKKKKKRKPTCFTGLNTLASLGSFPTPALYCQLPQLLLRS